jgi:tetratricopeptide (TPR) repeat protein
VLGLLEELGRRQALKADDQFLLARLYEAEGTWPKARDLLRDLTGGPKNQPGYLLHYARGLARQRDFDEALRCVERLEQMEKAAGQAAGSLGSTEARILVLEGRGEIDKAIALLKAHVERAGAHPSEVLIYSGYLARHSRAKEALELCDKAWETSLPEAVGGTSVAVLRAGAATAEQFAQVDQRLRAAIKKYPHVTALMLQLADLQDARGQAAEAEALYRQVLDRDPRNVVAANNLAWLLAQRPAQGAEAQRLIERAIEIAGPRAELLDTRAAAYLAQGLAEEAVTDLEVASRDSPSGSRFFRLARAYKQANNAKAAARAWRQARALELRPEQLHATERNAYDMLSRELEPR